MVSWLLRHRVMMSIVAYFLVALMLCSTVSPFSQKAEAAGEAVGMGLIIAILSAFGITVSSSGAISGMTSGLSDLMEQFSQQMYNNAQHFKDLFSAHITMAGYGIAKIGSVLSEAISDFISWLKSDKDLGVDSPIVDNTSLPSIEYNGISYPISSSTRISFSGSRATFSVPDENISRAFFEVSQFVNNRIIFSFPAFISSKDGHTYDSAYSHSPSGSNSYFGTIFGSNGSLYYPTSIIGYYSYNVTLYCFVYDQELHRVALIFYNSTTFGSVDTWTNRYIDYNDSPLWFDVGSSSLQNSSWVINDDNLDLGFLDNVDGTTKDVYFTPSLPDIIDQDLSTVGGLSEAADQQLTHTYDLTGTAEITGTMDITQEFDPDSGGSGNVPPIYIPSGGWFTSIWHYVVKALQDSAQGVAFIIQLVTEFIPLQLLNLCWASAVLCITFGIVNKFLK